MAELRLCYYVLRCESDPDASLESFIENFVAIEKENIFGHAVTPLNSPQNVHVLNYWRYTLRAELGFDAKFITNLGTLGQDRFNGHSGNALDTFFNIFTPKRIINSLTLTINNDKPKLCQALKIINEMNVDDSIKHQMCLSDSNDIMFADRITPRFIENYLIENKILEYRTPFFWRCIC